MTQQLKRPVLLTIHSKEQLTEELAITPNWFMGKKAPDMEHLGSGIFDGGDGFHYVYSGEKRIKFNNPESAEMFSNGKQVQFNKAVKETHDKLASEYSYCDTDKAALQNYTDDLKDVNRKMVDGKELSPDESTMVDKVSKILDKNKTTDDMVVYSGTNKKHADVIENSLEPIHHPSFVSSSISPNIARGFAEKHGGHIIELHIPKGTPSAYVSHISAHDGEREVILPRGMKINIDHTKRKVMVHDSGNFIVHHGELVNE